MTWLYIVLNYASGNNDIFFVKSDFWIFWSMLNVDFSRENDRFARFLNKGNVLSGLRRGAT